MFGEILEFQIEVKVSHPVQVSGSLVWVWLDCTLLNFIKTGYSTFNIKVAMIPPMSLQVKTPPHWRNDHLPTTGCWWRAASGILFLAVNPQSRPASSASNCFFPSELDHQLFVERLKPPWPRSISGSKRLWGSSLSPAPLTCRRTHWRKWSRRRSGEGRYFSGTFGFR